MKNVKNSLTARQMVNIELSVRAKNKTYAKKLTNFIPQEEQKVIKIPFNCECSDPACKQRILLSLDEYEKLHTKSARFIIIKGHNEPIVEKVVVSAKNVSLVEKYSL